MKKHERTTLINKISTDRFNIKMAPTKEITSSLEENGIKTSILCKSNGALRSDFHENSLENFNQNFNLLDALLDNEGFTEEGARFEEKQKAILKHELTREYPEVHEFYAICRKTRNAIQHRGNYNHQLLKDISYLTLLLCYAIFSKKFNKHTLYLFEIYNKCEAAQPKHETKNDYSLYIEEREYIKFIHNFNDEDNLCSQIDSLLEIEENRSFYIYYEKKILLIPYEYIFKNKNLKISEFNEWSVNEVPSLSGI